MNYYLTETIEKTEDKINKIKYKIKNCDTGDTVFETEKHDAAFDFMKKMFSPENVCLQEENNIMLKRYRKLSKESLRNELSLEWHKEKLEKENERLKKHIEEHDDYFFEFNHYKNLYAEAKKIIEQLGEKNEILLKDLKEYHEYKDQRYKQTQEMKELYDNVHAAIKRLKP
jgi:hypothetical protein